jgi:hypothetical protein
MALGYNQGENFRRLKLSWEKFEGDSRMFRVFILDNDNPCVKTPILNTPFALEI